MLHKYLNTACIFTLHTLLDKQASHNINLIYADVNILGGSVHTVKKNAEALLVASKEIGLEVNADETKYMLMSRNKTAGWSHSMKVDNSSFERVKSSNIWEQH
jgi:hypothetical protein